MLLNFKFINSLDVFFEDSVAKIKLRIDDEYLLRPFCWIQSNELVGTRNKPSIGGCLLLEEIIKLLKLHIV